MHKNYYLNDKQQALWINLSLIHLIINIGKIV